MRLWIFLILFKPAWSMKPRVGKLKLDQNGEKNQKGFIFGDNFTNDPFVRQVVDVFGDATDIFDPGLKQAFQDVIYYKPPVGIVAFYCFVRLLLSGRIFRMKDSFGSPDDVLKASDSVGNSYHRRRKKPGRAWNLAKDDIAYDSKGGVEAVRSKLCQAVLTEERREYPSFSPEDKAFSNMLSALKCSYRRKMSRFDFIKDITENVIAAEQYLTARSNILQPRFRRGGDIIEIAQTVASMRALDALLRVARDRLITISSKLQRNVKYWESRVKLGDRGVRIFGKSYLQDQRDRYTLAVGAYRNEVDRLGKIQAILNKRPLDMEEDHLVESIAASKDSPRSAKESRGWPRTWLSKLSLNFDLEGEGNIGLSYFDESTYINHEAARETLSQDQHGEWTKAAKSWINNSRNELRDVLLESIKEDIFDEDIRQHIDNLLEWCQKDMTSKDSLQTSQEWDSVIKMVDSLSDSRRVGEGKMVLSFFDKGAKRILKDLDVFGIPSVLLLIVCARLVHEFLLPRWPLIVGLVTRGYDISWTVFSKNIWEPIKDIVVSLARRTDESLLEFFDVENEVTSLDNMLKDLGFGDGTIDSREQALKAASRQYESDLDSGMIRSAFGGRLTRLLLLQVQQLKAGLLHALDSIDILVASNRLNMQLAAAIPAVLFFTFGTRLLVRSIFNLRLKSIRSIGDVHAEMSDYLDEMEKCLLLETDENQATDIELGEFVLHMHGYLVLLDYSAPLLPTRSSEAIHNVMLDLFSVHQLGPEHRKIETDRQVQILRLVKEKHRELLRYV